MIDKGKYASHGAFIKKINQKCLGRRDKTKLAIINPVPSSQPRQKTDNKLNEDMKLQSKTFDAKFKFQQQIKTKPIPMDLIQPFLYIERVMKPMTVDEKNANKILKPFITSKKTSNRKNINAGNAGQSKIPEGYNNLFEYQLDRKNIANKMFQKILDAGIQNIKDLFNLWNKNPSRKLGNDINIQQEQFIEFVKEMLPNRISTSHIKRFFQLYKNKGAEKPKKKEAEEVIKIPQTISIRAFSFNFGKFKKSETEISNIMSEKASKDRYKELKIYTEDFLKNYPALKEAMKGIKQYEQVLRNHFQRSYQSYINPFEDQINHLLQELKQPIIKYDKSKKQHLEGNVAKFQQQNRRLYDKLTDEYNQFMDSYESAIVKNHDLFFTKRTVVHLLKPVIDNYPYLTRQLVEEQVQIRRQEKQHYLQSLSDIVVELDNDKKHIVEDTFTLADIVQIISGRKKKGTIGGEQTQFIVASMKKLIKQIKRQFLLKNKLQIENIDNFPADQEIPLQIIHTCFQMQCTKVLFKNQIWNQLLNILPQRTVTSRFHQLSIDSNTCMEYLLKYFRKLDERAKIELNKSKQISLLAQNAYNHNFGQYAQVINKVCVSLDNYVEGLDEEIEENLIIQNKLEKKKKKVGFADIVDTKLSVDRGEENALQKDRIEEQNYNMAKSIIKMIHQPEQESIIKQKERSSNLFDTEQQHMNVDHLGTPVQNLSVLKTLARSYFEPQAMNTNAFDIRFYQKINQQEKRMMDPSQREQKIQLGYSMLLKGAPNLEDIQGQKQDPLRISRFLLKNIDKDLKQSQKHVKQKAYDSDIKEGVSHNYFRQKIQLQNKPTRYDSEGKSKYSVLLPVGYYESYIVGQNVPEDEKWYLRPHHVQTLTQNPLSKKDNIINTQYQSKLQKIALKKRPDEFVIEENVKRKQGLISALQERINALKGQVYKARRSDQIQGTKVPTTLLDQYYSKLIEGKQDKELELAGYESVMFDLRRKQRQLLNEYRNKQTHQVGQPNQKWWQRKDKYFNNQLRKDRQLLVDSMIHQGKHRAYVEKLKNNEIY